MIKAVQDKVFIRKDAKETKTSFGLIIPEKAQKSSKEGTIVAIGPGAYSATGQFVPTVLKVDDRVLFNPGVGFAIVFDGEELFVTTEKEIFGIFE